jgi:DNA sulfur modification protein DndD
MPEVYIDALTINNFGPYYGEHTFEFGTNGRRTATLIGGKNGAGKTHLLRALYLATVGESGAIDLKKVESGSDATRFELAESLNRRAKSEGQDTCSMTLRLSQRDDTGSIGRTLTLVRQIRQRPNSPPVFYSKANLSGDSNWIDDDEKVQKLRDAFLPRHLTRFFFFDAERSQSIQLNEREITEGISRVLGLFSYSELEEDIRQLTSTKIPRIFGHGSDAERRLNDITANILRFESDLKTLTVDESDQEQELRDADSELVEIEDRLRTIGAVDPEELAKAHRQRESIKTTKDKLEANLGTAWESILPVSLLGAFRSEMHDYLIQEERRRDWENRKASVEPKIPQVKRAVFDGVPENLALSELQKMFYERQLDRALQSLFNPPPEGMSDSVYVVPERNELSIQVRTKLRTQTTAIQGLSDLCLELERKTSELRELDQTLKALTSDGAAITRGNELREQRGALLKHKEQIESRISAIQAERVLFERKLQEQRKEETILSEQVQKVQKGRDLNSLAHRYREAVSEIKSSAAISLREKISDIVGGLWLDITDRGIEYVGMDFDQHWNCFLKKVDGTKVSWETANTSAGQRQVRILAFTEALRRLGRFVTPLVVDTPLGRLDKEVRESVLERLYLSGHQSIILTTNAEIDPKSDLFDRISPHLARVYTLNPEGNQESMSYQVRVSNDYFKRVL